MKRIVFAVILLAVAAAAVYSLNRSKQAKTNPWLELSGTVEAEDVSVGSIEGGRVKEVLAREGDFVDKGQVLLRLQSDTLEGALAEALAAQAQAQARLLQLQNGYNPEDIDAARAGVGAQQQQVNLLDRGTRREQIDTARANWEAAVEQFNNYKTAYERQARLLDAGVAPRQTVDNARTAMESARDNASAARAQYDMALNGPRAEEKKAAAMQLEQGRAQLRRLENGPRAEEIAQAQAALDQTRARVQTIRARLDEMEIRAPSAAVVDAFEIYPGDLLSPGESVARLVLSDKLWVKVYVPEDRLGAARPGDKVELIVDSFPGRTFAGAVSRVAQQAEFTPRNVQTPETRSTQVFETKIIISDPDRKLRAGMSATVRIKDKQRTEKQSTKKK